MLILEKKKRKKKSIESREEEAFATNVIDKEVFLSQCIFMNSYQKKPFENNVPASHTSNVLCVMCVVTMVSWLSNQ